MTTETQQALAVVFRRFKEDEVPRDDLVKTMSLELSWTKPSTAENLLDRGLNAGYLDQDDGGLEATFDVSEVDVPFGFDPSDELFEPVETDPQTGDEDASDGSDEGTEVLEDLLDRIGEAVDGDRNRAVAAANAKQDELEGRVTLEAAALLTAHAEGLDVRDQAREVLDELRRAG